jgi:hypothetical protein
MWVTGITVSKKSRLAFCLKPFATSLALNLSIVPSGLSFFLRTHLQPMVLQPGGNSTNFQVLLEIKESISSFVATFQNIASGEAKASFKFGGFSSRLKT